MPQFTSFPYIPGDQPYQAVEQLIVSCQGIPSEGEPLKEFRNRLKDGNLWKRERMDDTYRFLGLVPSKHLTPSQLTRELQVEGDAARDRLTKRLWEVNPLLFKTVLDCLAERVYLKDELYAFVDSFAYRGAKVHRLQLEAWIHLAMGLEVVKVIGIALGLGSRAGCVEQDAAHFDIEEYLQEVVDEEPEPGFRMSVDESEADAVPQQEIAPAVSTAVQAAVDSAYPSPLGRHRPVPFARFQTVGPFSGDVLDDTSERITLWWSEQTATAGGLSAGDFSIDANQWMDNSEEALYRMAVAAALVFRLGRSPSGVRAAFESLDASGVLSDLYFGTAPEILPSEIDPQALMLASLVARRCAENPELAVTLEKQESAEAAFAELGSVLGRGLFSIELFWVLRNLGDIGAVRYSDLANFAALPTRAVRDVLFRLGYLESPYAPDSQSLIKAASAAVRAAGSAVRPDEVLRGFGDAAGCAYACPNRRKCDYACRERADR